MIKYATYNRFAHLFMQFLKNVASTAGSSVSLTLGYKITARVPFEKVFRHKFDLIVLKWLNVNKSRELIPPAGFEPSQNFSKCSESVTQPNKMLCFTLVL